MRIPIYPLSLSLLLLSFIPATLLAKQQITLDQAIASLEEQYSSIESFEFELTQRKHRTEAGMQFLIAQFGSERVFHQDNPTLPERKDFHKIITAGVSDKYYMTEERYNSEENQIVGSIYRTWNGEIGKRYIPNDNSGRIERNPITDSEELVDKVFLKFEGIPIYQWLAKAHDTAVASQIEGSFKVSFVPHDGIVATYIFKPSDNWAIQSMDVVRSSGQHMYKATIQKHEVKYANGIAIPVPVQYESIMYMPAVSADEDTEPLVVTDVQVLVAEFNKMYPDSQFDIQFPADADVYDEFIGQHRLSAEKLQNDIDKAVKEIENGGYSLLTDVEPSIPESKELPHNAIQQKVPVTTSASNLSVSVPSVGGFALLFIVLLGIVVCVVFVIRIVRATRSS